NIAEQRESFARQRLYRNIGQTVVIVVPEVRTHAGDRLPAVAERNPGSQPNFLEGPVSAIVEQKIRHVVVGNKGVLIAISVVIGKGDTHSPPRVSPDSRFCGNILKRPVSAIAVERCGQRLEIFWVAIVANVPVAVP